MAVSEASLKRYVEHASYRCYQELLTDSRAGEKDGWKPVKTELGISVSRRREGRKMIVRGQSVLNISVGEFQDIMGAIDTAKQWDKSFKEGECLQQLEQNLSIVRLVFGQKTANPLFRNREFIVHERREIMDDGTAVVAVVSLPPELAAGIYPEQKRLVDPAGWFPKCIVNVLLIKLVFVIFHLNKLTFR